MELQITDPERELLARIIEQYYSTLREEIYKTEAHAAKTQLKREEEMVKNLLTKIQGGAAAP